MPSRNWAYINLPLSHFAKHNGAAKEVDMTAAECSGQVRKEIYLKMSLAKLCDQFVLASKHTVKPLIQVAPNTKTEMFLVSSCNYLCQIHWSEVLSREWRCSWSSADRRCVIFTWVINNSIAHWCVTYIRNLMACKFGYFMNTIIYLVRTIQKM